MTVDCNKTISTCLTILSVDTQLRSIYHSVVNIIGIKQLKNRQRIVKIKVCDTCENEFKSHNGQNSCRSCYRHKRKVKCPGILGVDCQRMISPKSSLCIVCENSKRLGELSPTWKGGLTKHSRGYVLVRQPKHPRGKNSGYVFEHVLMMEAHLGRFLEDGENVHHINGIKNDNRIENLELWVRPQPSGIRARDAVKWAYEIIQKYGGLA